MTTIAFCKFVSESKHIASFIFLKHYIIYISKKETYHMVGISSFYNIMSHDVRKAFQLKIEQSKKTEKIIDHMDILGNIFEC